MWLRNGFNSVNVNQFRSHTGKKIQSPYFQFNKKIREGQFTTRHGSCGKTPNIYIVYQSMTSEKNLFFRPFVIILFRSLNIEQVYNLLVVEDPYQQVKQKDKLERKTYQSKKRHEIVSCMGAIGSYFTSYLTRTVLSIGKVIILMKLK